MPKFSIVIPVYKVEKDIMQCLESVICQTYNDFEVLVVDDCVDEISISKVKNYARKDDRIKIFSHEECRGLGATRNTALKNASGKYIVFLNYDKILEKNCLDVLNAEFKLRKTCSIWFNSGNYIENKNNTVCEQLEGYLDITPHNIANFSIYAGIKAYARESIQKYNLEWSEGLTFEDGEFYFKYFTLNPKTYVISDCLINCEQKADNIISKTDNENIKLCDIFEVLRHLHAFWTKLGLYEEYKQAIIKLISTGISDYCDHKYTNEYKKQILNLLQEMNYPDDFHFRHKKNNPLVSVVIPVYNVEPYIAECIDSIENQTYKNLEIIFIDDCGQDNSMKIVEEYAKNNKRIKIIRQEVSKGAGGARNTGIENSTGKYLHFVDPDDYLEPHCISSSVNILEKHDLNVIFFKSEIIYGNNHQRYPIWYPKYRLWPEGHFIIDESNMCDIPCQCWNKGYRTSFLTGNHIRMPENILFQDVEFSFRMFTKTHETYMIDEPLYIYRIRTDSSMYNIYTQTKKAEDLYIAHEKVYDFLVENNLIEKYKNAYLELAMLCMENYHTNSEFLYEQYRDRMLEFLNYIGFPDEYKTCKTVKYERLK